MSGNIRVAIIDVGTLKSKFEIREYDNNQNFTTIHKDKKLTVLGRDLQKNGNKILEESLQTTIKALKEFKQIISQEGVSRWKAVTTEAVRKASNADKVLERIKKETGIELETITHEDEARIFFLHISKRIPGKRIAVADVGGGSVQLVIGTSTNIENIYLFKTGTYFMQEELYKSHHPTSQEFQNAKKYIKDQHLALRKADFQVDEIVYGSTNIIDFMEAMRVSMHDSGHEFPLNNRVGRKDLDKLFKKITYLSYEDRMPLYPAEPYYMWSADNALLNIFSFMDTLSVNSVIPTNENISSGLFAELVL